MSPKRRGPRNGGDGSVEEVFDIISIGDSDSSVVMTGRRRKPTAAPSKRSSATRSRRGGAAAGSSRVVPDVYQEMLAEALPAQPNVSNRPLKKRRTGRRGDAISLDDSVQSKAEEPLKTDAKDDGSDTFEDVLQTKMTQTAYKDTDDESDASDLEWEAVNQTSMLPNGPEYNDKPSRNLELTLNAIPTPQTRVAAARRKAVTKAERLLRLQVHKMHLLCLLVHVDKRNTWCNDFEVQHALKGLLSKKMLDYLRPKETLPAFSRANALKDGLALVNAMWKAKYTINKRGMRRALWAEKEADLANVCKKLSITNSLSKP
jgi:xeroderma pigmentosum group C-complementing protein